MRVWLPCLALPPKFILCRVSLDYFFQSSNELSFSTGKMQYEILARCHTTQARVSRMTLARQSQPSVFKYGLEYLSDGETMLPTFMPVATQAAIKGLTPEQVESLGVTLILNNTYHLNLRPGIEVLNKTGGAHQFQGWNRNLLTVCAEIRRCLCSL